MKRLIAICSAAAMMLLLTTVPVFAEGLASNGTAATTIVGDWPGQYTKWDQMTPGVSDWGGASFIDPDTGSALSADDFLCTQSTPITDIHFAGWSTNGNQQIQSFRITFWSDFPRTPNDESHPYELVYDQTIGPADPEDPYKRGWQDNGDGTFRINLPENLWFNQNGTSTNPIVYWIGIQGVMVEDSYSDSFYWNFVDQYVAPLWGDDASFTSEYFEYLPWYNWGWPTTDQPALYDGPFPEGWVKSADMAFALSAIPEPATICLLGLGALSLLRRKR
jgi:hypothetical protein